MRNDAENEIVSMWFSDRMLDAEEASRHLAQGNYVRSIIENQMKLMRHWDVAGKGEMNVFEPEAPFPKFSLAKNLIPEGAKVLDVGCYTGYFLRYLELEKGVHATGIDIFDMSKAETLANGKVKFRRMHAREAQWEWRQTFDVATCFDVLEHLFDDVEALDSIEKTVKPGGLVIINLPQQQEVKVDDARKYIQTHPAPEHLRVYDRIAIEKMFGRKKNYKLLPCADELGRPTWFITYNV